MPHKRAKLSARQSNRAVRGTDLPPASGVSLANESVPKSLARVLHAEGVRQAYREKRLKKDEIQEVATVEREPKRRKKDVEVQRPLGIKHGESLAQYNRRVEEEMRIPLAEAMHTSRSTAKRARKADADAAATAKAAKAAKATASKLDPASVPKAAPPPNVPTSKPDRKTEFDRSAPITRLNDIVQAPPTFTKLPRGATKRKAQGDAVSTKSDGVVSMAQKHMMEEERERAIKRYRELKEVRGAA